VLDENLHYQKILQNGLDFFLAFGIQAKGEIAMGDPVHEIVQQAKALNSDLIIVGHKHQEGWVARWWGGQVSKSLIENSPCNVLVVVS
jgi:nucleotide-binding universal stress UspA family protein